MKLIIIISISLVLTVSSKTDNKTESKWKDVKWESLSGLTELGKQIKDSDDRNVLSIIGAVAKLGEMVPYLGPFATLVSAILGIFEKKEDPTLELLKKMNNMLQDHLFNIENKLDALATVITDTAIKANFKTHEENIHNLYILYDRFVKLPNSETKQSFVHECKNSNMLKYAHYIDREISTETNLAIKSLMLDEYNLRELSKWSKPIITSMSQAMILHNFCMATQYKDDQVTRTTIQADNNAFKSIIKNLENFIRKGNHKIRTEYYVKSNSEIDAFARSHTSLSHENFIDQLWPILTEKYFWRSWLVVSYSGGTAGFDQHCVAESHPHVHHWFRQWERSVYIGSTNNPANFEGKLQGCIDKFKSNKWHQGPTPKNIYNDVSTCLWPFNGLGVVHFGNGLWASRRYNPTPFINVQLGWGSYSVFAMAPEINEAQYYEMTNNVNPSITNKISSGENLSLQIL